MAAWTAPSRLTRLLSLPPVPRPMVHHGRSRHEGRRRTREGTQADQPRDLNSFHPPG